MQTARIWSFAIFLLLIACVKTGSVTERRPLAPIPANKTFNVVVKNPEPDWQRDADALREGLLTAFADHHWWKQAGAPDVVVEITLTDFDKGNKAARMFTGTGEAELKADVVFRSSDGTVLGDLVVTGNSKRPSHTTIGGYDTSWSDSLPGRAVRATIDQICDYIEAHNKG
jgi:hypothetical protein